MTMYLFGMLDYWHSITAILWKQKLTAIVKDSKNEFYKVSGHKTLYIKDFPWNNNECILKRQYDYQVIKIMKQYQLKSYVRQIVIQYA